MLKKDKATQDPDYNQYDAEELSRAYDELFGDEEGDELPEEFQPF